MANIYPWLLATQTAIVHKITVGRLHHALLIDAHQGMGKYELSRRIAKQLLCSAQVIDGCGQCKQCNLFEQASHPDYVEINDIEAKSIGVDAIRKLVEVSHKKSQLGGAQVFVINNCQKMTESAANALLKTLEEPSLNSYFILTTDSISALLPTIISRCQHHNIPSPTLSSLKGWLIDEELNADDFSMAYQDIGGSPLRAQSLLKTDYTDKRRAYLTAFKQLLSGKLNAIQFSTQVDESELSLYYMWMINALTTWYKVKAAQQFSCQKTAVHDPLKQKEQLPLMYKIDKMQQLVLQAQKQSGYTGVNKKLIYQQLCLNISHCTA